LLRLLAVPGWSGPSIAHITADALDALGRADGAKTLRERYGLAETEKPDRS
jgi:hypothetical protein